MDYKEKINREKKMLRHWDEIRPSGENLSDLLMNRRKFNPLDYITLYQCMTLVLENLEVYEEEIKNTPDNIKIKNSNSDFQKIFGELSMKVKKHIGREALREIECLFITMDDKSSIDEKFTAIQKIKKMAWKSIYKHKQDILEIIEIYPGQVDKERIYLIFKCISMVLLELEMQRQEKELLENLYNFPGE